MTKSEFLAELRRGIGGLPEEDINRSLEYYAEMIGDRIEDGTSEEEAVAAIGAVGGNVAQILADIPLSHIVKEKIKPKRALRVWEIALIIVTFPVWFSVIIALFALVLALPAVLWGLVVMIYALTLSFGVLSLACIVQTFINLFTGYFIGSALFFGIGLGSAGLTVILSVLSLHITRHITRAVAGLFKGILLGCKKRFAGNGGKND